MARKLAVMSCIHIGDPMCRLDLLRKTMRAIKDERMEWACVGDIINNGQFYGTKHVGSNWDDEFPPDQQVDEAVEILKPIKSQCVSIISGNHAGRTRKATSFDPEKTIAQLLGVKFHPPNTIIRWNDLRVVLAHGISTGDFGKLLAGHSFADIFAIGHTHELKWEIRRRYVGAIPKEMHLVRVGTYLDQPRYAREALYPPTPLGCAVFRLKDNGQVMVELGR